MLFLWAIPSKEGFPSIDANYYRFANSHIHGWPYCQSSWECHSLQGVNDCSACMNQGWEGTLSPCCMQGPWVRERGDLASPCQDICCCHWFEAGTPGVIHCLPKQALKALRVIHRAEVSLFPLTTERAQVTGPEYRDTYWSVSLKTLYVPFWIHKSFCGRAGNCTEVPPAPGQISCPDASPIMGAML